MSPRSAYAEFHTYSQGIAEDFLQSVVVVDDKAQTNPEPKEEATKAAPAAGLAQPGRVLRGSVTIKKEEIVDEKNSTPLETEKKEELSTLPTPTEPISPMPQLKDTEVLPIKALNEAFAQHGIVCGFLSPSATGEDRKEIIERVVKSAKRADIVILDWKMEKAERPGSTALEIIDNILKSDDGKRGTSFRSKGRLRLIIIYSQSVDLTAITDDIHKHLNADSRTEDGFKRLDDFTLCHESTRISIFRKSGGTNNKDGRTYDVNALTDKAIDEFTLLTEGLLSNVAIEALSALRQNTHKILQKFNASLDAPYLTHRALTDPSEETQSHPIALLASEMQDVLEGNSVTDSVSPQLIKLWIERLAEQKSLHSSIDRLHTDQLAEYITDAVTHGVHKDTELSNGHQNWKKFISKFRAAASKDAQSEFTALMLAQGATTAGDKDKEFAMLTTIRSHYNAPPPFLNLGSIIAVREGEAATYYICIQPVCDCVRIDGKRKFPFLKLNPRPSKFDVIVKDNGKLVELKVDYKLYNMETLYFMPEERLIKARQVDRDIWIFDGTNESGTPLECFWIADLKFAHAQRIVERFASETSRVGLTESEWLRRMAS